MVKAQVEVQFNWVFVLIAGAIILLFFVGLVFKQKASSQERLCGDVLDKLEFTMSLAQQSPGTEAISEIGDLEFQFSCFDYNCKGSTSPGKSIDNDIVFAPSLIKGERAVTWAKEWNVPFKVSNFLYITVPQIQYYIIYDNNLQFAQKLYADLPDNITKTLISLENFKNSKYDDDYAVKLLFIDVSNLNMPSSHWLFDLDDDEVSAVFVETSAKTVHFYGKNNRNLAQQTGKFVYSSEPELYGAVYTTDAENYACNMQRAYNRLEKVSNIYLTRTKEFDASVDNINCRFYYSRNVLNALEDLRMVSSLCKDDFSQDCASVVLSSSDQIREDNRELIRAGCPRIY